MTKILTPGDPILFMKVGMHAAESLEDIIARKKQEIEDAGYGLWGYGGNTCHPRTMVQPFAERYEEQGQKIRLCMEQMDSKHSAAPLRASEFSTDGVVWQPIPDPINAVGSRFALVIKTLEHVDAELTLEQTRVAVGPNQGRRGDLYVRGRADKACLEVLDANHGQNTEEMTVKHISLAAELAAPYAVFLRSQEQ